MKKLLTLVLVLCIASSANALIVTVSPTGAAFEPAGVSTIDVVSDSAGVSYDYFLHIADLTYGDITSVAVITPGAGGNAATNAYGTVLGPGTNTFQINALDMLPDPGPEDIIAGVHFTATVNFTGAALGEDLTIQLLDGSLGMIDSYTLQGVPEPATMLLLGLGGLLLRRRK